MAKDYKSNLIVPLALLLILPALSTAAPPLNQLDRVGSKQQQQQQQPQEQQLVRGARLLDRFNYRYPDGSYEFRFELDDGTARYERGYFAFIDEVKTLMVVGYYSYRMPDGRYITVFYNADQFGYRQNQSITPEVYPNLPRSIEVPVLKESTTSTATVVPQKTTRQPSTWGSTTPRPVAASTRNSGRY